MWSNGILANQEDFSVIKIAISTPAYGEMFYTAYVQSLFRLARTLEQRQWPSSFAAISYADIVESRNFLLTRWFDKTDASHVLFLDADMGFDPQLIVDMIAFDQPLTGVACPKRKIDLDRLVKLVNKGLPPEPALARAHSFNLRRPKSGTFDRKGFIEVDGCGAGILLIKRSCVDEMLKKFPELSDTKASKTAPIAKNLDRLIRAFDPVVIDGARLSEDLSFCHRWRQCGGQIWANIAYEITHVGLHHFKGRYRDAMSRIVVGGKAAAGKVLAAAAEKRNGPSTGDRTPLKTVTGRLSDLTFKSRTRKE
jgi:hypothetical protein